MSMDDMMRLVEPLIPPLRRYASSLLRDQVAADDLVQDCLERVIARWGRRRKDGDTRTWVFTILHNLAIDRLRHLKRRGRHENIDDTDDALLSRPALQEDALLHRDLLMGLHALPEVQRSVLLLVWVDDLSYAEAARVLDVPIGTVMSRLARARAKLMQYMEGENIVSTTPVRLRSIK